MRERMLVRDERGLGSLGVAVTSLVLIGGAAALGVYAADRDTSSSASSAESSSAESSSYESPSPEPVVEKPHAYMPSAEHKIEFGDKDTKMDKSVSKLQKNLAKIGCSVTVTGHADANTWRQLATMQARAHFLDPSIQEFISDPDSKAYQTTSAGEKTGKAIKWSLDAADTSCGEGYGDLQVAKLDQRAADQAKKAPKKQTKCDPKVAGPYAPGSKCAEAAKKAAAKCDPNFIGPVAPNSKCGKEAAAAIEKKNMEALGGGR